MRTHLGSHCSPCMLQNHPAQGSQGCSSVNSWTQAGNRNSRKRNKSFSLQTIPQGTGAQYSAPLPKIKVFLFSFMSSQAVGEGQENKKVAQSPHSLLRPHLSHLGPAEKSRTHLPGLVMRQSQNTWNTWRVYCYLRLPPNFHSFREFPVPDLLLTC